MLEKEVHTEELSDVSQQFDDFSDVILQCNLEIGYGIIFI
jgi:hypothetical protein